MHLILGWALPCLDDGFHRPGFGLGGAVAAAGPGNFVADFEFHSSLRFFCLEVALLMRERGSHADVPSSSGMFGGNRR